MTKMNKKIKKLWVKALRSGKFTQDSGVLMSNDGYCCLGVLATIQGCKPSTIHERTIGGVQDALLNKRLSKYSAGLDFIAQGRLANYNDTGKSFKWIASYVERYL